MLVHTKHSNVSLLSYKLTCVRLYHARQGRKQMFPAIDCGRPLQWQQSHQSKLKNGNQPIDFSKQYSSPEVTNPCTTSTLPLQSSVSSCRIASENNPPRIRE